RVLGGYARDLERLGVTLGYRALEPGLGSRKLLDKDFDVTVLSWTAAKAPGLSEGLLWGSTLADAPKSYALAGVKDSMLDAAIAAMQTARTEDALAAAARAFDRAFRWGRFAAPLWRDQGQRIAWWGGRFGRPDGAAALPASPLDRWWALDADAR
ncbi:MAG: hypothetical protein AAF360_04885, partial [Pseudomonadota bacterium]